MAEHNKDQKLDALLDSLLRNYSAAEPRPGMETRILAGLKEVSARRRPWYLAPGWIWASAAAAVTAVVAFVLLSRPASRPHPANVGAVQQVSQQANPPAPVTQPEANSGVLPDKVAVKRPVRRGVVSKITEARLEVFPSPSPLSDQEKMLLKYLANTPREELVAQSRPDETAAEDAGPQDQSALPAQGITNQRFSNTR